MSKLLSAIALVMNCFAAQVAAQVYVPAPIIVPPVTDFSNIVIQREIGRTAAKRSGVYPEESSNKSPTTSLARQMPSISGPYLANIGRVGIPQKGAKLSSTGGSAAKRPEGQTTTIQPAGDLPAAQGTACHASQAPFVPQQLAERLGKSKRERQHIKGILTKCLNFYRDTAKQKGIPLHDVALALNYFISANYFVYSSGAGPTPEQMSATRDSIRANMVQDDTFRRMSDKQKQEAYETLIVLASFVDLGTGTAEKSGDTNAKAQFREMAKLNLETLLGTPIEKIHFTKNGLALN